MLVVVATAATGCAHGGLWSGIGSLPEDTHALAVDGRRQQGSRCGPNALAMVLTASGDPIPEEQIAASVQRKSVDAALSIDLLLYARGRGFPAEFERGSIERLIETLAGGEPCILLLNLELGAPWPMKGSPLWHYVVAYGFSKSKRMVLIHSGVGAKTLSFDRLEELWKPGGFWMMYLGVPVGTASGQTG